MSPPFTVYGDPRSMRGKLNKNATELVVVGLLVDACLFTTCVGVMCYYAVHLVPW